MPFKSEAQRKYLWANEPGIARDWTDTYGSGIQAAHGGRIGFASGLSLVSSLRAMSDEELTKWNKEQGGDPNAEKILKERANTRVSGKVKDAGPKFFNLFPGMFNSTQEENSSPLMKEFEFLKREKGMSEGEARHYLENKRSDDPKAFEEKFNIGSYRDLSSAFDHAWDSASLLDKGIGTLKNAGENVGGGILKIAQALDPFGSAHAAENKGSFTLPEKKYRTSNVYDDIGQHSERRIQEKPFSENYDYDKGNFVGIDNIEPSLGMDGFLDIDGIETPGKYITYEPKEAQTWLQKQLEKHNAAQRAYNDTTGLNTNYYAGSLHGNIDNAARVGRRNQARIDNVLGDFISGKSKMSIPGRHNLVGFLGTPKQQEIYLHEYGKQTGMNPNGTQWSNPYVDQSLYNNPDKGGIIGTLDPYGNTITRDTINQDVTGMYTPSGSSGMDDIGDITSSPSVDDSWGDVDGVSYIARGGMVKDAPRYRYAEGGIVNLLPKGAW